MHKKSNFLFSIFLILVAGYAALSASHWSFKTGFSYGRFHSSPCPRDIEPGLGIC